MSLAGPDKVVTYTVTDTAITFDVPVEDDE